ncbi:MAG: hypothetical protein QXU73_08325 [Thermoplasmata archaeon]
MQEMQYAGWARKKKDKTPVSHYVSRLSSERPEDLKAYAEIVQYRGGIRGPKDVKLREWKPRLDLLDIETRQFYVRGLLMYDGKSFSEMLTHERNLGYCSQPRTLQRRLDLLVSQRLARRDPPRGGRGVRGVYYFIGPSKLLMPEGVLMPEVFQILRGYIDEGSDENDKKQRLASILEFLVIRFGAGLTSLLRRLLVARKEMPDDKLFKAINEETYWLDVNVDFVALRMLWKEYPSLAEGALDIFEKRSQEQRGLKLDVLLYSRIASGQ